MVHREHDRKVRANGFGGHSGDLVEDVPGVQRGREEPARLQKHPELPLALGFLIEVRVLNRVGYMARQRKQVVHLLPGCQVNVGPQYDQRAQALPLRQKGRTSE